MNFLNRLPRWGRLLLYGCAASLFIATAALLSAYFYVAGTLPKVESLADYRPAVVTRILSDNGSLIAEIYEERRSVVPVARMPRRLIEAFVAAEDANFFQHRRIDLVSILRAAVKNLLAGGVVQGGSTLTKELIDNALDACEEAMVLPDIYIGIRKQSQDTMRIIVEDNGPGIVPRQIPFVFGKLLYGSRFHQIKQSRGQQGIGISAAVVYAQLTSGLPTVVISRTGPDSPAHRFEVQIDIETNEPAVIKRQEVDWDRTHGTRIQIEFRSNLSARRRLIEYLKYTSVVNPHARIRLEMDDETVLFDRVSDEIIACPKAIRPHPHGFEIGQLRRMAF